jgi:hypothetical protein
MNKKQLIIFGVIILLFSMVALAEQEQFDPFPKNRGTVYEYKDDDVPAICFFPEDKARWDGSRLTAQDWPLLTDYQKAKFILEYMDKYHSGVEINEWDYLVVLNALTDKYEDKATPMTMFVEVALEEQDKDGNLLKRKTKK